MLNSCIIDPTDTSKVGCCKHGSTCRGPCSEDTYQCDTTLTLTTSATTTTSVKVQCCGRRCNVSSYLCPPETYDGCCLVGRNCASGSGCLRVQSETSSVSLSIVPPGCTTGQISCAASLGGGCCAATQSCTLVGTAAHCAEVTPTGSDITLVHVDEGLSAGAKGGIAAGVVVGCALVIGAVTWWCLRRRRERRQSEAASGSHPSRPNGVFPQVVGGGSGGGREMSDEASDMMSRSGRGGLAHDYFGPAPAIGPYSETHSTSPVTTPGMDQRGGVPLQPHGPGDIAAPVEIDSHVGSPRTQRAPSSSMTTPAIGSHGSESGQEWYELYGSNPGQVSPYLPSPRDEQHK